MSKTINLPFRHDAPLADQCSHGKLWTEFCRNCRIIWLEDSLKHMEPQVKRDRAELDHLHSPASETGVITCAECGALQPPGTTMHTSACSSLRR